MYKFEYDMRNRIMIKKCFVVSFSECLILAKIIKCFSQSAICSVT